MDPKIVQKQLTFKNHRKQLLLSYLCSGGGIDLSETINESIEVIAKQRKSENRENLLAGRAMNRLRSMRKEMGEVKIKDEGNERTAEVKKLKQNDFTFEDL